MGESNPSRTDWQRLSGGPRLADAIRKLELLMLMDGGEGLLARRLEEPREA
jgi:hypothetical protein